VDGPLGYVLANDDSGAARSRPPVRRQPSITRSSCASGARSNWPDGAKGKPRLVRRRRLDLGLAHPDLVVKRRGVDPKQLFNYSDGATHAANEIGVASGQSTAHGLRRNRNADDGGRQAREERDGGVWTSEPFANRRHRRAAGFRPGARRRIQKLLVGITEAQAKTILPNHYTGFVAATHENYRMIEDRGPGRGVSRRSR